MHVTQKVGYSWVSIKFQEMENQIKVFWGGEGKDLGFGKWLHQCGKIIEKNEVIFINHNICMHGCSGEISMQHANTFNKTN